MIKAIDVCGGAGGWAVAARGLPITIVAAFDRAPDALATYKLNHPLVECIECDVASFDFSPWRGIDLILGGIPCETLSAARNNRPPGKKELSGFLRLLHKMLDLPTQLAAVHWCYEDVIQLRDWLPDFTPSFQVDSAFFSAQTRKRLFVGNTPRPSASDARPCSMGLLSDHLRTGPYRISGRIHGKRSPERSGKSNLTFQPMYPNEKSKTVADFSSRHDVDKAVSVGDNWRQLEWQECASLQGFPTDYIFVGNPGRVSKMIGQAIQIETGRAILSALCAQLLTPQTIAS